MKNNSKVINFGCRLNTYESQIIKSHIKKNDLENTYVFNTCAVTNEAEKQAKQAIRKIIRLYPKAKIVVTGCGAQTNPSVYESIKGVDFVVDNSSKLKSQTWVNIKKNKKNDFKNIFNQTLINKHVIENFDGMSRAYVEIQQGCDHRCTFCIIPFGRGNNRSVPFELIVKRVKKLVSKGYNEIVLTGVDITDYGLDITGAPSLSTMIKNLLIRVPDLKQLRLSSVDCAEIDENFWELLKYEKRLMPHLHLSLQSGDNIILKRMKRRHNREQAIEFCKKAKSLRPDIIFGADLIVGFPTESDKMFENTIKLIEECDLTFLHVFQYSQKIGTPASRMPQVENFIKKKRSKILREIAEGRYSNFLKKFIGKKKKVLIEKKTEEYSIGRTQEYSLVKINKNLRVGNIYDIKIKSIDEQFLVA